MLSIVHLEMSRRLVDIPTLSYLSRDETRRRRRERRITATRSGPFFRKVPFSIRPGALPLLHIAEVCPWRGYARGFPDRQRGGPVRYLLRGCVPGRYYYLYHAHISFKPVVKIILLLVLHAVAPRFRAVTLVHGSLRFFAIRGSIFAINWNR